MAGCLRYWPACFSRIDRPTHVPKATPIRSMTTKAGFPETREIRTAMATPIQSPLLDFPIVAPRMGGSACAAAMAKTTKLINASFAKNLLVFFAPSRAQSDLAKHYIYYSIFKNL